MSLLERSFHEQRPVELIYLSKGGHFSQRVILVKSIHPSFIKAYCYHQKQIRTFLKESILSIEFPRNKLFRS